MISTVVFWTYTIFGLLPTVIALFVSGLSKLYVPVIIAWFILLWIKLSPTGSQIPQYQSFCRYRLHCPNELLPKMKYSQIKQLLSVKELDSDFAYVSCDYDADKFIYEDYYDGFYKDNMRNFVICYVVGKNDSVILNPATYLDYFAMCAIVKRGLKSLCTMEIIDAQLKNLADIREVIREVQDKETAKMQSVASENQEIESRIISDRKAKIKAK